MSGEYVEHELGYDLEEKKALYTVDDIKSKVKNTLTLENIVEKLPYILAIGAGLYLVDKVADIGGKLDSIVRPMKKFNRSDFLELIDTIGDNVGVVDLILKALKIDLGANSLHKISDFMQNVATIGKQVGLLVDLVKGKGIGSGGSGVGGAGKKSFYRG